MGFLGALALSLIALKLIGIVTISWWWVLLPLYGGIVLWFIIVFVVVSIVAYMGSKNPSLKKKGTR